MTRKQFADALLALSRDHDDRQWSIGDLYNEGRRQFGAGWCKALTSDPRWLDRKGVPFDTVKTYAYVARRYPPRLRYLNCAFTVYHEAASLPADLRMPLLARAELEGWPSNRMRVEARWIKRAQPTNGTNVVTDLADMIRRGQRFRGLLADPPWPWTGRPGKQGAAEAYYGVMSVNELAALPVRQVATDDAMLFLWTSAANLKSYALPLMEAWDFDYRGHAVWLKEVPGTGAYWRYEHEDLLLGVLAATQTHFDDDMISSVISQRRTEHSAKPEEVHRMVERAIGPPYLELFGRREVEGWTVFGNQRTSQSLAA